MCTFASLGVGQLMNAKIAAESNQMWDTVKTGLWIYLQCTHFMYTVEVGAALHQTLGGIQGTPLVSSDMMQVVGFSRVAKFQ